MINLLQSSVFEQKDYFINFSRKLELFLTINLHFY